jgi:hypothetical protein
LNLLDTAELEMAAHAVALGGIAVHPFANFYVITSRPDVRIMRHINRVKGRPADQVASVTTTREHFASLFDWSRVPESLSRERIEGLMDALLEMGPCGFRGPAADHLPEHLTSPDAGVRTVQAIGPGARCPSNQYIARTIARIPEQYLSGTSANPSRHVTGAADEPVHYRIAPLQAAFGREPGFFMLRHPSEWSMQTLFPLHPPMSTSILSFHKVGAQTLDGRPTLVVERHGSLALDALQAVAERFGWGLELAPSAQRRLSMRTY